MQVELARDYRFEAAHRLPRLPEGHKCARMHGHNFVVTVTVAGEVDEKIGVLIDFGEVDRLVRPLIETLDHRTLNDIEGLENPTSEFLARWLWGRLRPSVPLLHSVSVAETCDARCTFRGQ